MPFDSPIARSAPFVVVLNAASGPGGAGGCRAAIEEILGKAGQSFRILPVQNPSELSRVTREAAESAVRENGAMIAAGGDGTINAVVQQALPSGRPFGVIPSGTFNYSARAHGIPLDSAEAARALLNARVKPVQVGLLNDRVFLVNASLGLYPEVLQEREDFKRQYGRSRLVAIWAGFVTLLREHRTLLLNIEHEQGSEVVRTPTLFVGNNTLQLEEVGLPEAEVVGRRRLAAVMVRPMGTRGLLWLAVIGALGRLGSAQNIRKFTFRRLTVEPRRRLRRPIRVATDGEVWRARPPLVFSVAKPSLLLMIPAASGGHE